MPIRVTHILAPVSFGGGEALLANLIAARRPDLLESMITLGRAPLLNALLDDSGAEHRAVGNYEVGVQRKGRRAELIASLPLLGSLRSALAELRPDVIHAHGFPPSLLGCFPMGNKVGRVYTHHYERQPPGRPEKLCLTAMFNRYDALTTVADHLSASMNNHFPRLKYPFTTLRIAVRDEFFNPSPSGVLRALFPPGTAIGVCVGRFVATKNQRLILESLAVLPSEVSASIGIVLVGSGPDETDLRKLAVQLGIDDRVIFLGQLSPETMPSVLADADFGIFPTVTEASSLAAAEALAAGLPLLALDLAPMRETAEKAGIFVSTERFASGLASLASTHSIAAAAARDAAKKFRMSAVRAQWAELYHQVNSDR